MYALIIDDDHLARQDITDELCAHDIESAALRGQHPAAFLSLTQAKRTEALRITGTDELVLGHDGQAVGTLDLLQAVNDPVLNAFPTGTGNEVHEYF